MTESSATGGDTPCSGDDALAAAVQELAVTTFHGDDAIPDEPDRLAAARRRFPTSAGGDTKSVEGLADLAIACPGKVTVESTDHRNEALTQTCRDRPGARNGTSRTALEAATKAQQSGDTQQHVVVQRNESGHRRTRAHSPQP